MIEKQFVCLQKFLGRCPNCIPDVNPKHRPNNLDCPGYKKMTIGIIEVKNGRIPISK